MVLTDALKVFAWGNAHATPYEATLKDKKRGLPYHLSPQAIETIVAEDGKSIRVMGDVTHIQCGDGFTLLIEDTIEKERRPSPPEANDTSSTEQKASGIISVLQPVESEAQRHSPTYVVFHGFFNDIHFIQHARDG